MYPIHAPGATVFDKIVQQTYMRAVYFRKSLPRALGTASALLTLLAASSCYVVSDKDGTLEVYSAEAFDGGLPVGSHAVHITYEQTDATAALFIYPTPFYRGRTRPMYSVAFPRFGCSRVAWMGEYPSDKLSFCAGLSNKSGRVFTAWVDLDSFAGEPRVIHTYGFQVWEMGASHSPRLLASLGRGKDIDITRYLGMATDPEVSLDQRIADGDAGPRTPCPTSSCIGPDSGRPARGVFFKDRYRPRD